MDEDHKGKELEANKIQLEFPDLPELLEKEEEKERKSAFLSQLEQMRLKLLDLSNSNNLLNYKFPKAGCVRLIDELPNQIFNVLDEKIPFSFIPVPEPNEKELIENGFIKIDPATGEKVSIKDPTPKEWAVIKGLDASYELPFPNKTEEEKEKHKDTYLQTLLFPNQLESRLRSMRSNAETSIKDSGTNILYLTLGFLEWYEDKDPEKPHFSPLFSLPVEIVKNQLDKKYNIFRYSITLKDDNLLTNITLQERLFKEFKLNLPEIEDEDTPEKYFIKIMEKVLVHKPRWKVSRQASLVRLNFRKQVMYKDLDPKNWPEGKSLDNNPILKIFLEKIGQELGQDSYESLEEYKIDDLEEIHEKYPIVFDADSSQHSALIDAVNGNNLVIEGPPGTGKSQTIANLIAAELSNGKKILFVTDKITALEVVKKRLDNVDLGDFCLELHSYKTNKIKILDELMSGLRKRESLSKIEEIDNQINRYENLKDQLTNYAEKINKHWRQTGESVHKILNKATNLRLKLKINPNKFLIDNISGETTTFIKRDEIIGQAELLKNTFKLVSEQAKDNNISNHYWYGINNLEIKVYETDSVIDLLNKWNEKVIVLNEFWKTCVSDLEFDIDENYQIEKIKTLCESINKLPEIIGKEAFSEIEYLSVRLDEYSDFIRTYERIHEKLDELCKSIKPDSANQPDVLSRLSKFITLLNELGIESEFKVSELAEINRDTQYSYELANKIETEFSEIRSHLPETISRTIKATKGGLLEFNKFTRFLKLQNELWSQRNEIYDNPDLDQLLPKFSKELEWIKPLHDELHKQFRIHKIPELEDLVNAQDILDNAGFFAWFSSDWREARKLILSLSAKPKPNKKAILKRLPDLINYKQGILKIDELHKKNPILGDLYRGPETQIEDTCVPLRDWYKGIRDEYGFGFGDRFEMGNDIIKLDRSIAKRVNDIDEQVLGQICRELSEKISKISVIFKGYKSLNETHRELSGTGSPLLKLHKTLDLQINKLSLILQYSEISLGRMEECKEIMEDVHKEIEDWESLDIYKNLVPKIFPLSSKAGEKNSESLNIAKNTFIIFSILKSAPALLNSIFSKPDSLRYKDLKNCYSELKATIDEETKTKEEFLNAGKVKYSEWTELSQDKIRDVIQKNNDALGNRNWLTTWVDYLQLKEDLSKDGFDKIFESLEENNIESEHLIELIELSIYHQLSEEILAENEYLKNFKVIKQKGLIEQFKECDRTLLDLQCKKIAYKASRIRPKQGISTGAKRNYSELSLIEHENTKKKRHISVRELLKRSGNAISTLKPCFMMSPMSVAQYLIPGKFEFDLVVMDEASQIRPQDSLGAIARGNQLIVVGDPKQLPPTRFFEKLADGDDEDEDNVALQDTESILDGALPIFKKRRLRWHYRSRHDSLIAFSNRHFYDSDLVIFPSPFQENKKYGVFYERINGRCLSSINRKEARAIAQKAAEHLMTNVDESIGIVAMNIKQKEEIEVQLEVLSKEDPKFRIAFDKNKNKVEDLFIKNLETVQGDERDVIMISLTYGPEEENKPMFQRFPTINQDGGERRLNVLFTRAKNRMLVFSSMDSGDIKIKHDSKKGVKSLRAFLEYCETGHLHQIKNTRKDPENDFEISVMHSLHEYGYECEPQLGLAGFRLDLAVRDPKKSGRYLMGIECDGATYHSASSARDRDRLRQEILENLGWEIHRIWSTDWFKNPESQIQPIVKRLEELKTIFLESHEKEVESDKAEIVDLFPETEFSDQISFFDKKPITIEKQTKETHQLEKSVIEKDIATEVLTRDEQSNDEKLLNELKRFNEEEIMRTFPKTKPEKRLLRPKMLEVLIKEKPTIRDQFLDRVPFYLRNETEGIENRVFQDGVLEIISEFE